ncbi:MAG: hypothetical protein EAY75_13690 [Bacteroidetes bacterium]|nr:MAG: hypothetical protein EAY75_13690 [Bacteroidota bacterium]
MKYLLSTLLIISYCFAHAQTDSTRGLTLIRDPRVDLLVKKQAQINRVAVHKSSSGQYKGFRLMVLNTNNRDEAYNTKSMLLRRYPEQNIYMAYQAPYYKIKMGDFIKRADADNFKKQITGLKQSIFVVQDIIKIKPEDEAKLLKEAEN